MTLEERIENAARALLDAGVYKNLTYSRREARAMLAAGFPELFTDPQTKWLAPMEPDDGMQKDVMKWAHSLEDTEEAEWSTAERLAESIFQVYRDSVLNRDKKE